MRNNTNKLPILNDITKMFQSNFQVKLTTSKHLLIVVLGKH